MPKEIAVYLNQNGETTSIYEPGKIVVYLRRQGKWTVAREKNFYLGESAGIKELRSGMRELTGFLQDCKTFVGLAITGIPYFELEKTNCSVWECQGKPLSFLDYILDQEEVSLRMPKEEKSLELNPVEVAAGYFKISLKEIQEQNTGVTSKQVLLPLLRKRDFQTLEVICNHVPPWLEAELLMRNLSAETVQVSNHETKIMIT